MMSAPVPRRVDAPRSRQNRRLTAVLSIACALLTTAAFERAVAQDIADAAIEQCLARIPADAMARVPVYLEASADTSSVAILPAADTMTLAIARVIRSSIEHSVDSLPWGEPLIGWHQVGSSVYVTVYPDGRFSWAPPPNADSRLEPARMLITQVLELFSSVDERLAWPVDTADDSLTFRIRFRFPSVSSELEVEPFEARYAVPVFSMAMPWETSVVTEYRPRIRYPSSALDLTVEATVIMEFVVDTNGRVVPGSAKAQWPADKPRLTGQMGREYDSFVQVVTRSLGNTRFTPATLGGCAVPQAVQQPFQFRVRQ